MSTSGVVTFRSTRDQIIEDAVTKLGGADPENTAVLTTAQTTKAARNLNMLVKHYQTKGLHLFKRRFGVIFPQDNQGVFVLGSPGPAGDHASLTTPLGVGGFVQTTLSAAAASGASTVTLTTLSSPSSAGVAAVTIVTTWNIGVELDGGTVQWTTVNGAPSGTTCTLTATLTGAAASGNTVYAYATKLIRPLRILDAWIGDDRENASQLNLVTRDYFNRLGDRSAQGTPSTIYYDPQTNAGHVYVYPKFDSVDSQIYIEFESPIEDFTATGEDFDMTQEWNLTLVFNLALILAPDYTCPMTTFKQIQYLADLYERQVTGWDQEYGSIFIQPSSE